MTNLKYALSNSLNASRALGFSRRSRSLPDVVVFGDTFHCDTASTISGTGTRVPLVSTSQ